MNRFHNNSPVTPTGSFYQLPYELLMKGLEFKQKTFDTNQQIYNELDMFNVNALEKDRPIANEFLAGSKAKIEEALLKAGGDYSVIGNDILKLTNQIKKELKPGGLLGQIENNYKTFYTDYAANQKALVDGKITADDLDKWATHTLGNYKGVKSSTPGVYNTISRKPIAEYVDYQKMIEDAVAKLKPDQKVNMYEQMTADGLTTKNYKETSEGVSADRIYKYVSQLFANDPKVLARIKQDLQWGNTDILNTMDTMLKGSAENLAYQKDDISMQHYNNQGAMKALDYKYDINKLNYRHKLKQQETDRAMAQFKQIFAPQTANLPVLMPNNLEANKPKLDAPITNDATASYDPLTGYRLDEGKPTDDFSDGATYRATRKYANTPYANIAEYASNQVYTSTKYKNLPEKEKMAAAQSIIDNAVAQISNNKEVRVIEYPNAAMYNRAKQDALTYMKSNGNVVNVKTGEVKSGTSVLKDIDTKSDFNPTGNALNTKDAGNVIQIGGETYIVPYTNNEDAAMFEPLRKLMSVTNGTGAAPYQQVQIPMTDQFGKPMYAQTQSGSRVPATYNIKSEIVLDPSPTYGEPPTSRVKYSTQGSDGNWYEISEEALNANVIKAHTYGSGNKRLAPSGTAVPEIFNINPKLADSIYDQNN